MFRFFVVIVALVLFAYDSFAACEAGYQESTVSVTFPTTAPDSTAKSGTTWSATWSGDTASGTSGCSSSSSSYRSSSSGRYCWCKLTAWNSTSLTASWVYTSSSSSSCSSNCASRCADNMQNNSAFRSGSFNSVTNTPTTTTCTACPAKPSNATWTTGCNWQCSTGQYSASIAAPSSNGDSYGYYTNDRSDKYNYTSPALSAGEWSATWDNTGVAKGIASCNGTSGTYGSTSGSSDSFSTSTTGTNCWCKMTEWTPSGGTTQSLAGKWMFYDSNDSASSCAHFCANYCGAAVYYDSYIRSAVFGAVGACTACPDGGTSTAGATAITQCYIPTSTTMTDAAGTYTFTSNCYYSN